MSYLASKLDSWLYRRPFEGIGAVWYAERERSGFGDLDRRLVDRLRLGGALDRATTVLDVGSGPGTFATALVRLQPRVWVVAVEPSGDFPALVDERRIHAVRARAEALPLADDCVDLAVCLSSIRHVADRGAALRELRRVIARSGTAYIVDFDPHADRERIRNHARRIRAWHLRLAFGPLVVRVAPPAPIIAALARDAGFATVVTEADPLQPVYIMRLS